MIGQAREEYYFFSLVLRTVKIVSLILSRVNRKVGQKWEIPEKKPSDHLQTELGLSHMWPELGSNPQRWDDERFRVLKINYLNQSATGDTLKRVGMLAYVKFQRIG